MFCSRLGPLMVSQISSAVEVASSRRELGVATEVRRGVGERGLAQAQEPLDVPRADVGGGGVDVDAEVEEVAERQAAATVLGGPRGLKDVEALDDHDVGVPHHDRVVGHHVVHEVGVGRRLDLVLARLDVDDEPQQRAPVVGLGEALALEDAAALELGVRVEEAVGGDQGDVGVLVPVGQHLRSTRAVVDLPTATEPASPITNGVRGGWGRWRNSSCLRCRRRAALTRRLSRRESGR